MIGLGINTVQYHTNHSARSGGVQTRDMLRAHLGRVTGVPVTKLSVREYQY